MKGRACRRAGAAIAAASVIVTGIGAPAAAAADRVSAPGRYSGYSPKLYDKWERTSFHVPVRDGTRLAVDLFRPVKDGKPVQTRLPVVWIHTPYLRAIRKPDGTLSRGGGTSYMNARDLTLHGYVVAIVDTRGKGASFGTRRGMQDSTEARDAYDMTEWLAAQPWSNGKVGMMGCSYVGGTQDNAAIATPPSLKAIFPGATTFNRYDFVARGGLTAQYHTRPEDPNDLGEGAMPVDSDKDGSLLAQARDGHRGNTIMSEIWKDIPFRDDWSEKMGSRFWEETSLSSYRNAIEMRGPVMYRWTGWQDEFTPDQFVARANLRNVVKVFIGPEQHCRSEQFDMFSEHLRYFDRYLKDIDNGIDREPSITYYTYNAEPGREWAVSDVWPIAGTRMERWFVGGGRDGLKLAPKSPAGPTKASFTTDYSVVTDKYATTAWPLSQHGHGVSFTSAPFTTDARLTGHPVVSLWISTSAKDGDVFAYLEEVAPDGKATVRAHGRLRASHRALGTAPYDYLGLPWHRSFRADHQPMTPGVPAELKFDLLPTSTIIRKGMSLRLVVTGADPRQRSNILVRHAPAPQVTVHGGKGMPSYVDLPFVPIEPLTAKLR